MISFLALLSNYDQENCLINVGTEGWLRPNTTSSKNSGEKPLLTIGLPSRLKGFLRQQPFSMIKSENHPKPL
ncbi:MAG TPA: hypothetical protein VHA37_07635, partial [Candidatus Saccharimonadales bacterium]|nr:hypothetical protein [Candidatus Saccharimonadales bacterium]